MLVAVFFSVLVIGVYFFWPVIVIFLVSLLPVEKQDDAVTGRSRKAVSAPQELRRTARPPAAPGRKPARHTLR